MTSIWNLARRTTLLLDRPGTRWVVSALLPVVARMFPDGVRQIRYDRGWIHHFDEGVVVEPQPRLRGYDIGKNRNELLWGLLYKPKLGDTIVDVGAGLGAETIYYSRQVGPTGRVIAIEAHPEICRYLKRSIELSGLSQVRIFNLALSDKRETVYIENNLKELLGNALVGKDKGIRIEATTLDQLVSNEGINRIDFLKMNIEGAERLAIKGSRKALRYTSIICVSCHDFKFKRTGNEFFKTKSDVQKFIEECGFIVLPRESDQAEISDQINAFNPTIVDHRFSTLRT